MAAPDTFLELVGKDPTLTGRTQMWVYIIQDIWMNPWLGWGYFSFWSTSNPFAVEISNVMGFVVPQAHNGLLELLLNAGVLGTALFIFILIRTCSPGRSLSPHAGKGLGGIHHRLLCWDLLEGVSETVMLAPTQSLTPVLFITGLMCERAIWVAKGQPYRLPYARGLLSRSLSGSGTLPRARASILLVRVLHNLILPPVISNGSVGLSE